MNLRDVSRLLQGCRGYVGNDSGITHLAAYLGCPTVALFGPTDPHVWGPVGLRVRVLRKTPFGDITPEEVHTSIISVQKV